MRFAFSLWLLVPIALRADEPLVIRNAVVETLTPSGRIENATVVIRDGKIVSVGKDIVVPLGAQEIDAEGGTVMPGIIDPYFEVTIAATPGTAPATPQLPVGRGRGAGFPGGGMPRGGSAFTRIADNVSPFESQYKSLPRVGLTRMNLVSSGTGQAALLRATPAEPDQMLEQSDGIAYATVTNSTESLDQIRNRLQAASRGTTGRPGGFAAAPAAGDKLWADVAEGKVPLVVQVNNAAAVLHLLKATEAFKKVQLVLYLGGDAIAETTPELRDRKVRVILRPSLELMPNTRDRFSPARMLHEARVEFCFSLSARPQTTPAAGRFGAAPATEDTPDPTSTAGIDADFPLFPVAVLVKTGLPRTAALEALCRRPATMLGIEKTHGTIEPGKTADLLLFSGDPLDPASRLRRTIVDGRITYAN